MNLPVLDLGVILLLSLCGALIGMNKTGLQGGGMIAVALAAAFFGARPSTGIMLPILMFADLFGLAYYHKHVRWMQVLLLLPGTLVGILIATYVGDVVGPETYAPILAGVLGFGLLVLVASPLLQRRRPAPAGPAGLAGTAGTAGATEPARPANQADPVDPASPPAEPRLRPRVLVFAGSMGVAAGFSSMIGNAAGAVLSVYLLALHLPKNAYIGATAWYFFINNIVKVPFHVLIWETLSPATLRLSLVAAPAVVVGALVGVAVVKRVPERQYRVFVIVVTAAAVLRLLF
ncbi:MAG: sulfite exporter TauE/SafE family protein [Spirochaetaceae bacterium]|nr:MAG: sulfite exporter TauE/SafE family protein [Spirochaetaceae bacterium]